MPATTPAQRTNAVLLAEMLLITLSVDELGDGDHEKLRNLANEILEHFPRHGDLVLSGKLLPMLWDASSLRRVKGVLANAAEEVTA